MLRTRGWTFVRPWRLVPLAEDVLPLGIGNCGLPMPSAYKYLARIRFADASSVSDDGVADEELVEVSPERLQHRSKGGNPSERFKSCFDEEAEHTIFQSLDKALMDSLFKILAVVVD